VKEEDRFYDFLHKIGPVVPTRKMSRFVKADLIQILGTELLDEATWEKDNGPTQSSGHRTADAIRTAQLDGPAGTARLSPRLQLRLESFPNRKARSFETVKMDIAKQDAAQHQGRD
jgi:hypothetical protein